MILFVDDSICEYLQFFKVNFFNMMLYKKIILKNK